MGGVGASPGVAVVGGRRIERLRPEGLRSKPVFMPRVFDDPDGVLELILQSSPYQTPAAVYGMAAPGDPLETPWFIRISNSEMLVRNPHWIAAAKEAFSAQLVEPLHCTINVNGPAPANSPHMDLAVYRGFANPEYPIWILTTMSSSGLFWPWLVPVASGLAWFHANEGGEFEYWADGPSRPSTAIRPPMWNVGVMSDNEVMYHRVGRLGSADEIARLAKLGLKISATIHECGGDWRIEQEGAELCRLPAERLRLSLLWKAYVFVDEAHRASFENKAYDLDLDQVVDIFTDDLRAKGIDRPRPSDPLNDFEWRALLAETYRSPFT
jgi:hypothetical protein